MKETIPPNMSMSESLLAFHSSAPSSPKSAASVLKISPEFSSLLRGQEEELGRKAHRLWEKGD